MMYLNEYPKQKEFGKMMNCLKKYLVEFIGTFFLVFTIGSAVLLNGDGVIPAVAIGLALMIFVYAGGHISGGHYNPAVSLAVAMRGMLPFKHLIPYWIAQFLGATAAGFTVLGLASQPIESTPCSFGPMAIIIGEFLFTFALCYVVLLTATSARTDGNSYYGLAIGSTLTVGIFAVGGILCYGAFNPAVAVSLGIMQVSCWGYAFITLGINLAAAIIVAIVFKMVEIEDEY